jgi:hypothetical protein
MHCYLHIQISAGNKFSAIADISYDDDLLLLATFLIVKRHSDFLLNQRHSEALIICTASHFNASITVGSSDEHKTAY